MRSSSTTYYDIEVDHNMAPSKHDGPPSLNISALYNPVIVTVLIGPDGRMFAIPRPLICGLSAYFNKAFNGDFTEGKSGTITLDDTEEWVFECFVAWLYTRKLVYEPVPGSSASRRVLEEIPAGEQEDISETMAGVKRRRDYPEEYEEVSPSYTDYYSSDSEEAPRHKPAGRKKIRTGGWNAVGADPGYEETHDTDEEDFSDDYKQPESWPLAYLVELYVFGDRYDTKLFRQRVMETMQLKIMSANFYANQKLNARTLNMAFTNLPKTSPLHRLLMEYLVYDYGLHLQVNATMLRDLPSDILAELVVKQARLAAFKDCPRCVNEPAVCNHGISSTLPSYQRAPCTFHEHASTEETNECERHWEGLAARHRIVLEI